MANPEEWISEKLSKLLIEEERINTLNEIKDHFSKLNSREAKEAANRIHLPIVFDCLNDTDDKQVDLACEVLSVCMKNLALEETTKRYYPYLTRALNHPKIEVKCMALMQLERFTQSSQEDVVSSICNESPLLYAVIHAIGDSDLYVSKIASQVIINIGVTTTGIACLVKTPTLEVCKSLLDANEIVRFRFYEVLLSISKKSEDSMNAFVAHGLFSRFLHDLESEDVLIKINVIELLILLALTSHGYEFLEKHGIFKLFHWLATEDRDMLEAQLLDPAILKFFGNVAHYQPLKIFSKYPETIGKVLENINCDDLTLFTVSVDTIAYIGSKNEGKIALNSLGSKMEEAINNLVSKVPSSPTEFKVTIFNCLEHLLSQEICDNKVDQITHKWFKLIGENPMALVKKYCENPFFDLRIAGFGLLRSIAKHFWGQEAIRDTPGLLEFLLDRSAEHKKECKETKFEIVSCLADSSVFDNNMHMRLQRFVKEGPFFQQTVMEVAIEGDD